VGLVIDVDHFVDYVIFRKKLPSKIGDMFYEVKNPFKFYLFFHAYEYIPILFVLSYLTFGSNGMYIFLSYFFHIIFDAIMNQDGKIWKQYSLFYRIKYWDYKISHQKLFGYLFAFVLFCAVLLGIGVSEIFNVLFSINIFYFLASLVCYFALVLLWSYKLNFSLKKFDSDISFIEIFWINLWSMFANIFHQAIGLVSVIALTKNKVKLSLSKITGLVMLIHSVELVVRIIASVIGFAYLGYFAIQFLTPNIVFFFAILLTFSFMLLVFILFPSLLRKTMPFLPDKIRSYLDNTSENLFWLRGLTWKLFAMSLIGWVVRSIEWFLLSHAIGVPLPFLTVMAINNIVIMAKLVPIPYALGVYEISITVFLNFFNVPYSHAITFAILDRLNDVIISLFALFKPNMLISLFSSYTQTLRKNAFA